MNYHRHKMRQTCEQAKPITLYKKLILKQVGMGIVSEDAVTENFNIEGGDFWSVIKDP